MLGSINPACVCRSAQVFVFTLAQLAFVVQETPCLGLAAALPCFATDSVQFPCTPMLIKQDGALLRAYTHLLSTKHVFSVLVVVSCLPNMLADQK